MKKAIGYIRVSTSEQATEGISLDNQKAKIQAYCALNDLELSEIIEEAGKSGKNINREGIEELKTIIKGKSVDAIIVYHLYRLSRRVIHTLTLIEIIEKAGVTLLRSSPLSDRVDNSILRFEATAGFALAATRRFAQLPKGTFVRKLTASGYPWHLPQATWTNYRIPTAGL